MASSNNDLVIDWLRDCKRLTGVVEEDSSSSPGKSRGEASSAAIEAIFRVLDDPKINLEVSLDSVCIQFLTKSLYTNSSWKGFAINSMPFIGQEMKNCRDKPFVLFQL